MYLVPDLEQPVMLRLCQQQVSTTSESCQNILFMVVRAVQFGAMVQGDLSLVLCPSYRSSILWREAFGQQK